MGLAGCLVPVLPGIPLQLVTLVVWAALRNDSWAWFGLGLAVILALIGTLAKYLLPGRRLKAQGVSAGTLRWGALGALVGFFVVPVLGLILGFIAAVFLAEYQRGGSVTRAWDATRKALIASGWSTLIEYVTGVAIMATWMGIQLAS